MAFVFILAAFGFIAGTAVFALTEIYGTTELACQGLALYAITVIAEAIALAIGILCTIPGTLHAIPMAVISSAISSAAVVLNAGFIYQAAVR